ncbi:MAG: MBL fold metallo-hydrolase [Rhodospirillales bacterium]
MRVTILGSGASSGTPSADSRGWGKCDPENPRNRRTRPSALVETSDTRILIDTSPDLRQQLLRAGVNRLDAVVYTHAHADHLHGIDDLRAINRTIDRPLNIHADAETLGIIRRRFGYVFEDLAEDATFYYKPTLIGNEIKAGNGFSIGRVEIMAIEQDHGYSRSLGFRFGPMGFTTDVVEMSEKAFEVLEGIDLWIVGALGDKPHPTHADVDKALGWIERIRPRRAVLSHLDIRLDYTELSKKMPPGVEVAYDGMELEVEGGG